MLQSNIPSVKNKLKKKKKKDYQMSFSHTKIPSMGANEEIPESGKHGTCWLINFSPTLRF